MPMILSPAKDGAPIVIDKAVIMLGRHPTCDVVLTDSRKVSRKHCCVVQVNDKYFVRDLGSMNGIKVNGKRVKKESPLLPGDLFTVGDIDYRFQLGNAAKKATVKPKQKPPVVEEVAPVAVGLADSGALGSAPALPTVDSDNMPGLAPLESDDALPVSDEPLLVEPEIVEPEIVEPEIVEPEIIEPEIIELPEDDDDDDEVVMVVDDDVDLVDEVEVVDDFQSLGEVEIVDDIVEVVDDVEVVDEIVEVIDEVEMVDEIVEVVDDVEVVDEVVEVVDDVEIVDDVVEIVDDVDVVDVVEVVEVDDDFEDVVLLDEDDDFFDGPVEILE